MCVGRVVLVLGCFGMVLDVVVMVLGWCWMARGGLERCLKVLDRSFEARNAGGANPKQKIRTFQGGGEGRERTRYNMCALRWAQR